MNLTQWQSRPLIVKVFELCDECDQLKEGVRLQESLYPKFTVRCCSSCFARLIAEHEQLTYC